MTADPIVQLNEETFDEFVQRSEGPLLVDFWASWCGPCKTVAPMLEQLAQEFDGRARVAKVNVDDSGDLSARFGIRSIPTLIVFKNGKVVDQMIGAAPLGQIRQLIGKHLD